MSEALLLILVFLFAFSGFALFAMSQAKHWRRIVGAKKDPPRPRIKRVAGAALLLAALACALLRDGPSFGAILWALALSVAAFAVAMVLAWRPGWLRPPIRSPA